MKGLALLICFACFKPEFTILVYIIVLAFLMCFFFVIHQG